MPHGHAGFGWWGVEGRHSHVGYCVAPTALSLFLQSFPTGCARAFGRAGGWMGSRVCARVVMLSDSERAHASEGGVEASMHLKEKEDT